MRDLAITLLSMIVLAGILYGVAAFIFWEPNVENWHMAGRFAFILAYVITILLIIINYNKNNDEQEN